MEPKDIFYDTILNPALNYLDFISVGHTAENSILQSADYYRNNAKVQEFYSQDGIFNELKFKEDYLRASANKTALSSSLREKGLVEVAAYHPDNIWVSPEKRTLKIAPELVRIPNPYRQNTSITRFGKIEDPTKSIDEIAQGQALLVNPVEVANGAKPIWDEAPELNWWKNLFKTQVLAQYDSDGIHVDPITGKSVEHKKGDLKLNNNGTFYYENLEGRSVYGRQVLNKLNTLTPEDSRINQFDFFDSDDLEQKSFIGTTFKNLALAGTMFIPYAGPAIALSSVLINSVGLSATLAKMFANSFGVDSPLLNNVEAWSQSMSPAHAKTQYAQQHPWCMESLINLIGDVTGLLMSQRAIFKYAPGIIYNIIGKEGKYGMMKNSDEAIAALEKARLAKTEATTFADDGILGLIAAALKAGGGSTAAIQKGILHPISETLKKDAEKFASEYFNKYHKLGELIARTYMTALTVLDTYGEAILAGASPIEATVLTLGYAAMENKLLKSDIGRWIYPELRTDALRNQSIAKALSPFRQTVTNGIKAENVASTAAKKNTFLKLFNWGKDLAKADYSAGKMTVGNAVANGLAEGFEEVSEELLADFSKGLFNVYSWLRGSDVRMDDLLLNFSFNDDILTRYALNFVGGFGGGSISGLDINYKAIKQYSNVNSEKALGELIWMIRNNKTDEFLHSLDKMNLGDKTLGTTIDENTGAWNIGTSEDNLDLANKQAIRQAINFIRTTVESEGASLDDLGVIATMLNSNPDLNAYVNILNDYKYSALANSITGGYYLNRYNKLVTGLAAKAKEIKGMENSIPDSGSFTEDLQRIYNKLKQEYREISDELKAIRENKYAADFMKGFLVESNYALAELLSPASNELLYIQRRANKPIEEIQKEERQRYHEDYLRLVESGDAAEKLMNNANWFWDFVARMSPAVLKEMELILNINSSQIGAIEDTFTTASSRLHDVLSILQNSTTLDDPISAVSELLKTTYLGIEEIPNILEASQEQAENTAKQAAGNIGSALLDLKHTIQSILENGWVHPEVKSMLLDNIELFSQILLGFLTQIDELEFAVPHETYENILTFLDTLFNINENLDYLEQIADLLKALPDSPIIDIIKSLAATEDASVLSIIEEANKKEKEFEGELTNYILDKATLQQYDAAINALKLARAAIIVMSNDDADVYNVSGNTALLNKISENPIYAEMPLQLASIATEEINMLINRLEAYKGINSLNLGNKLTVQTRTQANLNLILYEQLRNWISVLVDDDEIDKTTLSKLTDLLNDPDSVASKHSNYGNTGVVSYEGRTLNFSNDERKLFILEQFAIRDALHNVFKTILYDTSGNLKTDQATIDKLASFFKNLDLYKLNNTTITDTSDSIDDNAFIWWLAAIASLTSNEFYSAYKNLLDINSKIPLAPLPLLEMAIFEATAFATHNEVFNLFSKAVKLAIVKDWSAKSVAERKAITKLPNAQSLPIEDLSVLNGAEAIPNFTRIFFIEGVAGSGKSTGVLVPFLKLLTSITDSSGNPILKNIWYSTITLENATNSVNSYIDAEKHNIQGPKIQAFGHLELLDALISNNAPLSTFIDSTGNIVYKDGVDVDIIDGELSPKNASNILGKEKPQIIILDEISRLTLLLLAQLQKAALENGLVILGLGDLDQVSPKAFINSPKAQYGVTLSRNVMPRSSKMGLSMRTDNALKTYNNNVLLANIQNFKEGTVINLKSRFSGDVPFGDKVYSSISLANLDSLKLDIEKMKALLNQGEKIGFIYTDETTPVYKLLTEQYADIIDPKKLDLALGLEARFYIADVSRYLSLGGTDNSTELLLLHAIYTAVTRASQASILVTNSSSITSAEDTKMELKDTYTELGLTSFITNYKNLLDSIIGVTSPITWNSPKTIRTFQLPTSPIPSTTPPTPTPPTSPENSPTPPPESFQVPTRLISPNELIYTIKRQVYRTGNSAIEDYKNVLDLTDVSNLNIVLDKLRNLGYIDIKDNTLFLIPELAYVYNDLTLLKFLSESGLLAKETFTIKDIIDAHKEFNAETFSILDALAELTNQGVLIQNTDGSYSNSETGELDGAESLTSLSLEEAEEDASKLMEDSKLGVEESPVEETKSLGNETFKIISHLETFNTFLTGEFDTNGNLIVPPNSTRIDSAQGLYKLNPKRYLKKLEIVKTLGAIRSRLKFMSNADFINWLQNDGVRRYELNAFLGKELLIDWAIISKAPGNTTSGKFSRFHTDDGILENLDSENSHNIPQKRFLSAVIYQVINGQKVPMLEIPIGKLESPFTIAYKLFNQQVNPKYASIQKLWNNIESIGANNASIYLDACFNMMKEIKRADSTLSDPLLRDLFNHFAFWTINSNCYISLSSVYKTLQKDPNASWSLTNNCKLLGNHYVAERHSRIGTSDTLHQYNKHWVDLPTYRNRNDILTSNILVVSKENNITPKGNIIATVGHPFILRSDAPSYFTLPSGETILLLTDNNLMEEYVRELDDPTRPRLVSLMYVIPPEFEVSAYLNDLHKFVRSAGKSSLMVGNKLSSYRILQALWRSKESGNAEALTIWDLIPITSVGEINAFYSRVDTLVKDMPTNTPQQKQDKWQVEILELEKSPSWLPQSTWSRALNNVLVGLVSDVENVEKFNPSMAEAILKCALENRITGILGSIKWLNRRNVALIGGYALQIVNDNGNGTITALGQTKPFRVDGKVNDVKYEAQNLVPILDKIIDTATLHDVSLHNVEPGPGIVQYLAQEGLTIYDYVRQEVTEGEKPPTFEELVNEFKNRFIAYYTHRVPDKLSQAVSAEELFNILYSNILQQKLIPNINGNSVISTAVDLYNKKAAGNIGFVVNNKIFCFNINEGETSGLKPTVLESKFLKAIDFTKRLITFYDVNNSEDSETCSFRYLTNDSNEIIGIEISGINVPPVETSTVDNALSNIIETARTLAEELKENNPVLSLLLLDIVTSDNIAQTIESISNPLIKQMIIKKLFGNSENMYTILNGGNTITQENPDMCSFTLTLKIK